MSLCCEAPPYYIVERISASACSREIVPLVSTSDGEPLWPAVERFAVLRAVRCAPTACC